MRQFHKYRVTKLLLAAFLALQLLGVAHAFEHPVLESVDQGCEVCVHGQGLDSALNPSAAVAGVETGSKSAETADIDHTPVAGPLINRNRDPPNTLPSI